MSSNRSERFVVFLAALAPRLALAWITFGTMDVVNSFRNTAWMLGGQHPMLPYLPGVELLIWIGGLLAIHTPIPAAAAYKLIPLLFDCAIAVLLRDARSLRAGLLYAIAPVPIILAGMHGQWDAIVLYFLLLAVVLAEGDRTGPRIGAGAAWLLSVIVKPIAVPLLPLFLAGRRLDSAEGRRHAAWFLTGAAGCGVLYLAILATLGYLPTAKRLVVMVAYGGSGPGYFGLPFMIMLPTVRYAMLVPLVVLIAFVWRGRLDVRTAVFLFLAIAYASGHLAPQYLGWVVPFALLCRRDRFAAVYLVIAGVFLVLFYRATNVNGIPLAAFEGAYGLLDRFAGLTPPFVSDVMARAVAAIGNYAIPLVSLFYAVWLLVRSGREDAAPTAPARPSPIPTLWPAACLLGVIAVAGAWAATRAPVTPKEFVTAILHKVEAYDLVRNPVLKHKLMWMPRRMAQPAAANPVLNLSTILLVLVVASSAVTWMSREKEGP